jgi:hypothetical protein
MTQAQNMNTSISLSDTAPVDPLIRAAGVSGVIAAVGLVLLIAMFAMFASQNTALGETFGMLNDICVALQYLLTIPIALALHRILLPHNPALIRLATVVGVAMMLTVVGLQLALVFRLLTFEQQVPWVTLAMIVGVGSWLVMTGLVAPASGRLPNSVLMSAFAVPYLGYPVWALWLGPRLLRW